MLSYEQRSNDEAVAWDDLPLTAEHAELLALHAVTPTIARSAGLYSVTDVEHLPGGFECYGEAAVPSIVFPWREPDGREVLQLRPDVPVEVDGEERKYLFLTGGAAQLGEFRPLPPPKKMLIVEGTKQALAAAAYAPPDVAVYGIPGCQSWMSEGVPTHHLAEAAERHVVILLDADAATNPEVYQAGVRLASACMSEGALSVEFVRLPGGKKAGLDDILGTRAADRRTDYLSRLILAADGKPAATKPKASRQKGAFFGDDGLLVRTLADAVRADFPVALARDQTIAVYQDGVYRVSKSRYSGVVGQLLGEDFRPYHRSAVEEFEVGRLTLEGRVLPERLGDPVLNLANGLLDLHTGKLRAHNPEVLSGTQLAIKWDPDATCPTYDAWALDMIPDQIEDLEEVTSTMLDPSSTPPKAAFLYGPSRSGKSTFIRLAEAMVGPEMCSGVTLQQLATDRFAAANVYSKMLNAAADVPASHIDDISAFKMLTGQDLIQANRKYGQQFTYVNQALFMFSGNELPTVAEASRAYLERIKPFKFGHSFAGSEDPSIEARMMTELPGILVRWVSAFQRLRGRGGYVPTLPEVAEEFETQSNRVRMWVSEEMEIVTDFPTESEDSDGSEGSPGSFAEAPGSFAGLRAVFPGAELPAGLGTSKDQLRKWFDRWAASTGQGSMGRKLFNGHLTSIDGVVEVRILPNRTRGVNVIRHRGDDEGPGSPGSSGSFTPLQSIRARADSESGENPRERVCPEKLPGLPGLPSTATRREPTIEPGARFAFDLETADVAELWSRAGFVRLAGYRADDGETVLTTDPAEIVAAVEMAGSIIGHNILGFDLLALAHHHGLDIHALADRLVDTKLVAFLADPPPAKMVAGQVEKHYSLDAVGERLLGQQKAGDLKAMAKAHGGFDKIPVDDPDFREYLRGDVELTSRLAEALPLTDYARREHRVAVLAAQISLNGFRVDVELLDRRIAEGVTTRQCHLDRLVTDFGLPSTRKDGKPSLAPQNTQEGREAIKAAFAELGVEQMPRTNTGAWATGSTAMGKLRDLHPDNVAVVELANVVQGLNGVRTVYQTIHDNLVDDRVHPMIDMRQASGRWSITKPGLTVMGKRGGRHVERDVFLPEPGHVIIAADLSQVDARAIAAHSQDPAYIELFAPGRDMHAEVAKTVWGDESRREDAKAIGHGWNYGMGLSGLMRAAKVDEDVAMEFDEAMCSQFPGLVAWRDEVRALAASGELIDNGFGRMMRPDPDRAWTQGPALIGQGCARDILMEGMLQLPVEVLPMLRAVVHDEVVLSVPEADAGDIERAVIEALSFEWAPPGASLLVPIVAGLAGPPAASWGGVYSKENQP